MRMNFTKTAKLNSKANVFGISFLRSDISEIIQNYEDVCPALILNHKIAKIFMCRRSMKTSAFWKFLSIILLVNTCESCTNI